ncbi:MAG: imidazole glycerol phosphate synthase subunit HisH [Actinomycetes bacterium]
MIAILDYGSGNLRSAERAFALTGHEVVVTSDPQVCRQADGLVVPGVGAFSACMQQLLEISGEEIIAQRVEAQKPLFGICVGMQILFTQGLEKDGARGLGIFAGEVSQIAAPILPHIGWNTVRPDSQSKLFLGVEDSAFYFVHSYAAKNAVPGSANTYCNYGEDFLAAVEHGNIVATQFHPEKRGAAGARLIKNWAETL